MQKPGDLQKPVKAGALQKHEPQARCRYCGFKGTHAEQAAHLPHCPNRSKVDDGRS